MFNSTGVKYRHFQVSPGGYRLKSLGTHHRPQPRAPGDGTSPGHDTGEQGELLPSPERAPGPGLRQKDTRRGSGEEQPGAQVGAESGGQLRGARVFWGKHSLPWLLLCAIGLVLAVRGTPGWGWTRSAAVLAFPLFFLTWTTGGVGSFGVAALLPALPFFVLLGSRVTIRWPRFALTLATLAAVLAIVVVAATRHAVTRIWPSLRHIL